MVALPMNSYTQPAEAPSEAADTGDEFRAVQSGPASLDENTAIWARPPERAYGDRNGATPDHLDEATPANDFERCPHCGGGELQLQRMVRHDSVLESWWLCLTCAQVSHREQPAESSAPESVPAESSRPAASTSAESWPPAATLPAAPRTASESWTPPTSVPASPQSTPAPASTTDFESVLRRVLDKEGAGVAKAARLRDELGRVEEDLQDLRTLTRLLDRFAREA